MSQACLTGPFDQARDRADEILVGAHARVGHVSVGIEDHDDGGGGGLIGSHGVAVTIPEERVVVAGLLGMPPDPAKRLGHGNRDRHHVHLVAERRLHLVDLGLELLVHVNEDGVRQGVGPFSHGSAVHTDVMKTQGLRQALEKYGFDAAFGGARRDEEKSRAKERIFSFRTAQHRWDPKNQRPELWSIYNARKAPGESIRVFPLSNWTELDVWQYIYKEQIPIVPLYFAAERPVVERDGALIMVDDDRMPLNEDEYAIRRSVRFRTLGCYPLTGAIESRASTLEDIIQEMLLTTTSERQGRVIDHDQSASMEKKKQEGYF